MRRGPGQSGTAAKPRASAETTYRGPYAAIINPAARANGLDPWWLAALLWVENRFKPTGDSPAGAVGIAQIVIGSHPDVSRAEAENPAFAIPWAARYLAELRRRAGGSLTRATVFYNTGPNASDATLRGAGVAYLDQVEAAYSELRKNAGAGAGAVAGIVRKALAWPLGIAGVIIGHPYEGTHTDYGNWESDNAVDIKVPKGTPVFAVDAGTIGPQIGPLAASGQLAGNRVHLVTAADEFYYAHLSRLVVRAGQRVRKGQLLGYSGSANGVDHLHLAERNTYDPGFAANPAKARQASFWGDVKGAVEKGGKFFLDPVGSTLDEVPGAGVVGDVLDPFKGLAAVGETFSKFLGDPAYPFLWLLFMLTGFALVYLGVTRLFGTKPLRDYAIPAAQAAATKGAA